MRKYWLGVASLDHVKLGEAGGFCQLCHGKGAPLNRMKPGDYIIYYSPKISLHSGEKCQCFSALGKIISEKAYEFPMNSNFIPFRKDVEFVRPIRLVSLSEINQHPLWKANRSKLRYGHFEIPEELFKYIYQKLVEN